MRHGTTDRIIVTGRPPSIGWQRKVKRKHNEGPNAILFTLDTLRADHLSCYGYERNTSPEIDTLAKDGVLMTNAYSQSTTTIPSHISIMTGQYLRQFGIYGQGEDPLSLQYDTLAECFRKAGYATAGFLSVNFMRNEWTGLGQGFRTFYECPRAYVHGEYIVNRAIDWLADNHGRRFFLWIHLYDCHVPYNAPEGFRDEFLDPAGTYLPDIDPSLISARDDEGFGRLSKPYYSDRYDGEVAYTDHQVGRVVSDLKSLGLLENTLVVIAADHGECLGEHSIYFDHVSLYEQNTHVPLVFSWSGRTPRGKRIVELCENVDIGATMLDLMGIKIPSDWRGRSLVPVWKGREGGRPGVVTEHANHMAVSWRTEKWTYLYQPVAKKENQSQLEDNWNKGTLGAWVSRAKEEELYDRQKDRGEPEDLSVLYPAKLEQLKADSIEWVSACGEAWEIGIHSKPKTIDSERLKQLRALGYVSGSNL
ncbi:MAG: sulfatase [bacterium]